ncbi:glutamate synthase [Salipaludibacillus keqinensis]|uniref:Glutamate synthase n=1 Tax=Salipaludibacillus keqinensis TaxID=2045207 RepID=A0A323TGJ0_9BACI|nr:(Fe-S)-binding protein [Salipaludibacillus keqinensis]PYZ91673.1 glutamate synthase [Salipaludibacillus keqinensis]
MTQKMGFMPGCSLPSYTPEGVKKTMEYLKMVYPDLGGVQKCCGKGTKALGQEDKFKERFAGLQKDIDDVGIEMMVVACQNCYKTIKETSDHTNVESLWTLLPRIGLPEEVKGKGSVSDVVFAIHDSCSTRYEKEIQDGIRWILSELGYRVEESEFSREKARCCGFGGMIVPANPDLAMRVMKRRGNDFDSDYVVVYCAACRSSLMKAGKKAFHILDLLWGPVIYNEEPAPEDVLSSPAKSWINRYKSKHAVRKVVKA